MVRGCVELKLWEQITCQQPGHISRRLFISLVVLLAIAGGLVAASRYIEGFVASDPLLTIIVGAVGGFVGLQRRLKQLSEDDLVLIRASWVYTILALLVGGILALLLYILSHPSGLMRHRWNFFV